MSSSWSTPRSYGLTLGSRLIMGFATAFAVLFCYGSLRVAEAHPEIRILSYVIAALTGLCALASLAIQRNRAVLSDKEIRSYGISGTHIVPLDKLKSFHITYLRRSPIFYLNDAEGRTLLTVAWAYPRRGEFHEWVATFLTPADAETRKAFERLKSA